MRSVLVVDDDEATRASLVDLVRAEGCEARGAGSLGEARELLRDDRPSQVLLDLVLPDGSGIDPDSLDGDTVVETLNGFRRARHAVFPIVRVFVDVTPPRPDPRVEVVARLLHRMDPSNQDWAQLRVDASAILDALDTMDPDPEQRGR